MCRNIRVLHNFEPPSTKDEIRAAAIQYVRKVGGISKVAEADQNAFDRAVDEIAGSTERLIHSLKARGTVRTRDGDREKTKLRWKLRETKMSRPPLSE